MSIAIEPIGHIHTPFAQKFAIPRQAAALSCAIGQIHFAADYADPNTCRGLEQFSHLWLIFQFHQTAQRGWSPTVRPPRLGGNKRMGVFATRSTHRPNALGMSVVKLEQILLHEGKPVLTVSGVDLVDQTPIIDIKPYIPYADSIEDACAGYAQDSPAQMLTTFSQTAQQQLEQLCQQHSEARQLIINVLEQDPRPAYHADKHSGREYVVTLYNHDIRWTVEDNQNIVVGIEPRTRS